MKEIQLVRAKWPEALVLQLLVGAIAQRRRPRPFTATKIHRCILFGLVGHGRKLRTAMGAVAKWLGLALAAGTPVVFLAGLHFHGIRGTLGNHGLGHGHSPLGLSLKFT